MSAAVSARCVWSLYRKEMVFDSGKNLYVFVLGRPLCACFCICVEMCREKNAGFLIVFFSYFCCFVCVCVQYAAGMAAASQTIIVRTALSYQEVYEVRYFYYI